MLSPDSPEFSRNLGFMSIEEQQLLNRSVVAIAGAGGDGGMLALQLARMGVGEIRLADPDPFEVQNINRQACCNSETIDVNKAVAVGSYINKINPEIDVVVYEDGITQDNVEDFVAGADLLVDETEFTIHAIGVSLARQARIRMIPNFQAMNVGFGTIAMTFSPKSRFTFEKMLGLDDDMPIDEVAEHEVSLLNWLPYLPGYVDLEAFKAVASGEKSAPSVAPGVNIASAVGSTQCFLNLVGPAKNKRPQPVYAPHALVMDAMTGMGRVIKRPAISSRYYMMKMLINNRLGRVPNTSYV